MKSAPRVSVLTPVYNTDPQHLREMIESVLSQTFKDFEFLILNDSPDNKGIEKIIQDYAKKDKRIKYSKNTTNLGISASRNKLLKMARGEYLAVLDHDDICVPTRLEMEVDYLDKKPHVGVVSGWLQFFGDDNCILKNPENDFDIKVHTTANCYIAHTAAMIRKSVLVDNNIEYEETYTPAEDYRLWARLMDVTDFYNLQTILVKYRWFGNNTSERLKEKTRAAWKNIHTQLINKYPAYWTEYKHKYDYYTGFRLRLFGFLPLIKIKKNTVYLFEFIPLCKMKWE